MLLTFILISVFHACACLFLQIVANSILGQNHIGQEELGLVLSELYIPFGD